MVKDGKTLVEHTLYPHTKRLEKERCFTALFALLTPSALAEAVNYAYLKEKTLMIAVDNAAMKMEFHYKRGLIKELLTQMQRLTGRCTELEVDDVKIFVSAKKKLPEETEVRYAYRERAEGDFENLATVPAIAEILERIRSRVAG